MSETCFLLFCITHTCTFSLTGGWCKYGFHFICDPSLPHYPLRNKHPASFSVTPESAGKLMATMCIGLPHLICPELGLERHVGNAEAYSNVGNACSAKTQSNTNRNKGEKFLHQPNGTFLYAIFVWRLTVFILPIDILYLLNFWKRKSQFF